jgi:hypothetical protein
VALTSGGWRLGVRDRRLRLGTSPSIEPQSRLIDVFKGAPGCRTLTDDKAVAVQMRPHTQADQRQRGLTGVHPDEAGQHSWRCVGGERDNSVRRP